jgi:acylphosphatase
MSDHTVGTWEILVSGIVQGVGFRRFAARVAEETGISGRVGNLPDGRVRIIASGPTEALERFARRVGEGPRFAEVSEVNINRMEVFTEYHDFKITE